MNFLGHLLVAERTGTSLAGSVLGDVVRGTDLSAYPPDVAEGVRLHRRVDVLTDRHPALRSLREAFPEGQRRFAGIVLDLVGDYALAADWAAHHAQPLPAFCSRAGVAIAEAAPWFQLAGGRVSDAEAFSRLLQSYATEAGIERAVARTAVRLRQPERLLAAAQGWQQWVAPLRVAWPALLSEVAATA